MTTGNYTTTETDTSIADDNNYQDNQGNIQSLSEHATGTTSITGNGGIEFLGRIRAPRSIRVADTVSETDSNAGKNLTISQVETATATIVDHGNLLTGA